MGGSERNYSAGWTKRCGTYINVNLETIVILCYWADRMNSAKVSQSIEIK